MTYTIFCLFDADDGHPFKIDVNEAMFVAYLQQVIKAEEPKYASVPLRKFELYPINARDINEARAKSRDLSKVKYLEAQQTISDVFGSGPAKGLIHLFVKVSIQ